MVFLGLVTACRRATRPTSRSPVLENATTEGVVRNPSAFGITLGSPPSMIATHELVVPRSMPMTFPMSVLPCQRGSHGRPADAGRRVARKFTPASGRLRGDLDLDLAPLGLLG